MLALRNFSQITKQPITLYGFALSQPTRSVLLLCQEANIRYNFVVVDALKGQNRSPEFRKIHPAGLVPAISEDEIGVLGECSAILQYLAETRCLFDWYPVDPVLRARVNFWLSWNHSNTRQSTKGLLVPLLFPPKTGSEEVINLGKRQLSRSLAFMETHLNNNEGHLVAGHEHITIADLTLITELDQLTPECFGLFDFSPYPNITNWMSRVQGSLSSYSNIIGPVVEMANTKKKINDMLKSSKI